MNKSYVIGFPRIGEHRELKKALEQFWAGKLGENALLTTAANLRRKHWNLQKKRHVDLISCNDFSLYDNMLDTAVMLGAIPARYQHLPAGLSTYFAMARGNNELPALEMTKWFNTNYHYIVPEIEPDTELTPDCSKIIAEYREAKECGITPKINIIGPVSFCALSKTGSDAENAIGAFDKILNAYESVFNTLATLDDLVYVQLEEPVFVQSNRDNLLPLLSTAAQRLTAVSPHIRIIVSTYFEHAAEAVPVLAATDIWGIGLDLIYGRKNLEALEFIGDKQLIAGVIDGRNIWRTDIDMALAILDEAAQFVDKEQIWVSTSCSLLHLPFSVANEPDSDVKERLSFACEKVDELALTAKLFRGEALSAAEEAALDMSRKVSDDRGKRKRTG